MKAGKVETVKKGTYKSALDTTLDYYTNKDGVQVGAAIFTDPYAPVKIVDGINEFLDSHNISSVKDIIGTVKPW